MEMNGYHSLENLMMRGHINSIKVMLMFTQESLGFTPLLANVLEAGLMLPSKKVEGIVIEKCYCNVIEISFDNHPELNPFFI
jgi:hypothetical protein